MTLVLACKMILFHQAKGEQRNLRLHEEEEKILTCSINRVRQKLDRTRFKSPEITLLFYYGKCV